HPLRERLRAQLMLTLYRSGRQAQALESYREGRELLVEELGLEPSPLLRSVHASILRQETFTADRGAIPEVEHFEEVAAALLAGKVTVVVGSDSEPLASELARRFCHIAPTGVANVIERPNAYTGELALDERTVLLHLQGRIDRSSERAWESFAVTEDDFIHYGDVARRLPVSLAARLRRTHLLLLGYTLSTWTLRVVLERFWGSDPLPYRSWSVHPGPQPLEREF